MPYQILLFSQGAGKFEVLRDKIPKITTARLLALRYSREYQSHNSGMVIYLMDDPSPKSHITFASVFAKEKIYWMPDGRSYSDRSTYSPDENLKNKSPTLHTRYSINGRTGEIKFMKEWRKSW